MTALHIAADAGILWVLVVLLCAVWTLGRPS